MDELNDNQYGNPAEQLLCDLGQLRMGTLAYVVEYIEAGEPEHVATLKNSNPKLYVVLKPTKDEYLQRFQALLACVDEEVILQLRLMLPVIKLAQCIDEHYDNGQISYKASQDLLKRLLDIPWDKVTEAFMQ